MRDFIKDLLVIDPYSFGRRLAVRICIVAPIHDQNMPQVVGIPKNIGLEIVRGCLAALWKAHVLEIEILDEVKGVDPFKNNFFAEIPLSIADAVRDRAKNLIVIVDFYAVREKIFLAQCQFVIPRVDHKYARGAAIHDITAGYSIFIDAQYLA